MQSWLIGFTQLRINYVLPQSVDVGWLGGLDEEIKRKVKNKSKEDEDNIEDQQVRRELRDRVSETFSRLQVCMWSV